ETVAEEYVSLIGVLTNMLVDQDSLDEKSYARALEIGRQWAQTMNDKAPKEEAAENAAPSALALESLFSRLRDLGFAPAPPAADPESAEGPDLDLRACPLTARGSRPHPFLCAVHERYFDYQAEGHVEPHLRLKLQPLSRPGVCAIKVRTHPHAPTN